MNGLLAKQLTPTNTMVRNLIKIQDAYINTYHPDFMGGANSIVNVFDINSYNQEQLNAMKMSRERDDFEQVGSSGRGAVSKIGNQADGAAASEMVDHGRLKNLNEYEIQKYMQKDIKAVHLPDMPAEMRARLPNIT